MRLALARNPGHRKTCGPVNLIRRAERYKGAGWLEDCALVHTALRESRELVGCFVTRFGRPGLLWPLRKRCNAAARQARVSVRWKSRPDQIGPPARRHLTTRRCSCMRTLDGLAGSRHIKRCFVPKVAGGDEAGLARGQRDENSPSACFFRRIDFNHPIVVA